MPDPRHHDEADEVIPASLVLTRSHCVHLPTLTPDNLPACSAVLRPAAAALPRTRLGMQISRPHPRPPAPEALGTGTGSRGQVTSMLTKVWELLPRVLFLFAYFQKTTYMRVTQECSLSRQFGLSSSSRELKSLGRQLRTPAFWRSDFLTPWHHFPRALLSSHPFQQKLLVDSIYCITTIS